VSDKHSAGKGEKEKKTCFVIAPIGEEDSEIRERSDKVLKHIIKPVLEELGYSALRADQISRPGMITPDIIQHVVEDPLVIADLTGHNPNVFYELALRHMVKKPVVQLINKGEPIPFDVSDLQTIEVDHTDLDSVEACKEEMKKQIQWLQEHADDITNPITVSVDLASLRESRKPLEIGLRRILLLLEELDVKVDRLLGLEEEPVLYPAFLRKRTPRRVYVSTLGKETTPTEDLELDRWIRALAKRILLGVGSEEKSERQSEKGRNETRGKREGATADDG